MKIPLALAIAAMVVALPGSAQTGTDDEENIQFEDVTSGYRLEKTISTFGAVFADIDNDGREDLFFTTTNDNLVPGEVGKQSIPKAAHHGIVVHELSKRAGQRPHRSLEVGPLGQREYLELPRRPHVHEMLKADG